MNTKSTKQKTNRTEDNSTISTDFYSLAPSPQLRLERPQRAEPGGKVARHLGERCVRGPQSVTDQPPVVGISLDENHRAFFAELLFQRGEKSSTTSGCGGGAGGWVSTERGAPEGAGPSVFSRRRGLVVVTSVGVGEGVGVEGRGRTTRVRGKCEVGKGGKGGVFAMGTAHIDSRTGCFGMSYKMRYQIFGIT